jgi:O-antigen/teichoic acid export membrane protein
VAGITESTAGSVSCWCASSATMISRSCTDCGAESGIADCDPLDYEPSVGINSLMVALEPEGSLTRDEVSQRAARGAYSVATRMAVVQGLQMASALVLARLIEPDVFGTFAVALTVVGAVRYLGDLGLTTSFITSRTVTQAALQTGALVMLVMAAAQASVAVALNPLVGAALEGSDDTTAVVSVLAATLVLDALRFGPNVRLNRELSFARLNAISLTETVVMYVVQIGLLFAGLGLWALVLAQVGRSASGTALSLALGRGAVVPRRRSKILPLVRDSFSYQVAPIVVGVTGMAAPLAVGLALDAGGVGLWAWSAVLATPLAAILVGVRTVALTGLSRLGETGQAEQAKAAQVTLRLCVLVIAWPAGILCGLAPEIVPRVFDERWLDAVPAVQFVLLGLLATAVATVGAAVLESRREAWTRARCFATASVIGLTMIYPLSMELGLAGAAIASGVVIPLVDAVLLSRQTEITSARALRTAAVGFGTGYAASALLAAEYVDSLVTLGASAFVAAAIAGVVSWLADREALRVFLRHARPRESMA